MKYYLRLLLSSFLLCFSLTSIGQTVPKVAIIGGGIAGTSAAYYLQKSDTTIQITLYEKELQLGGNAYTVEVPNARGEKVKVDVGPQYFCEGPWNEYIAFLDETIGMKNISTESMVGSVLVQQKEKEKPSFISPLNGSLRGEKLSNLLKFKRFNQAAYEVYKQPENWQGKSILEWVTSLKFEEQYKIEILYPFLAASLGTTVAEIKQTSVHEIVQLFGFRKPKLGNRFFIIQEGMGTLIQKIGAKLLEQNVQLILGATVTEISSFGERYVIHFTENHIQYTDTADFVLLGVHADQAMKILNSEPKFKEMCATLNELPYFKATIVVHNDQRFIDTLRPSFMNIATNTENEILYNTMNLSVISDRLTGIYKSWLSPAHVQDLTNSGKILYTKTFYHPFISTDFVLALERLKVLNDTSSSLKLIGGWLHGIETQNSAVVSAKKAVDSYHNFTKNKAKKN